MRTYFLFFFCVFFVAAVHAAQTCNSDMPASTPDDQLIDNGDGTITDSKTDLMWKQCLEGVDGDNCENNSPSTFTWQEALQQPGTVNVNGFAGYNDWRLPNIRELLSIVEVQCFEPAINATRFPNIPSSNVWSGSNATRFPNTPTSSVWSGSPSAVSPDYAWSVLFNYGLSYTPYRYNNLAVRLVRGGQ